MNILIFDDEEKRIITEYGELCLAVAKKCMERNNLNFDDIERINNHSESHRWGSNADRRYRTSAVNKAIKKVAESPLNYGEI